MIRDPEVFMVMMSNRNGTKDVTWARHFVKAIGQKDGSWEGLQCQHDQEYLLPVEESS